ncbi:sporulation protein [Thermocrinis ruber]|uniref:Sporulation protein n=1 Tax=Thermocrinis ruber TaxID=75906 RepID=W0DG39_9AQUI|nr:SPOR domain-containing protein [Thermocrinis ruber]AHE96197.1 sporulation protein [Thermocrinis ruber]
MRRERLLILLGTLIALIFFYVGLNKWLESKPESAPPPVVVKPTPPQPASPQQEGKPKEEAKVEEKKQTPPPEPQKQKEDLIAQKIQEEKTKEVQKTQERKNLTAQKQETREEVAKREKQAEKPKGEVKEYVIQIGAFSSKENADRALEKAKSMGYRGEIVNEDNFYKVRVRVKTDDPKKVLAKLKATFGGAIIKQ